MSFPFEPRLPSDIRRHRVAGAVALPERKRYLQRVDTPTAVGTYAGFAPSGTPGHFSPGNATVGQRGTIPGADWFEGVQEELINILNAAGIAPVKGALSQVWQAILACRQMTDVGIAANTCIANPTVSVTSLVNGMAINLVVANTNTGAATFNLSSLGALSILRPDGSVLQPADLQAGQIVSLIYNSASPQWRLLSFPARIRLTQSLALYVNSASGSDTNNGLSSGAPFATMNKAYSWLQRNVDVGGNVVTINCAGTTLAPLNAVGPILGTAGAPSIVFLGNTGAPSAVQVNASNTSAFTASQGAQLTVNGFQVTATGTGTLQGIGMNAYQAGIINFNNIIFGACAIAAIAIYTGGTVAPLPAATCTISGNMNAFLIAGDTGCAASLAGLTLTLSGTPVWANAFVVATKCGEIFAPNFTATGAATGARYLVSANGVIDTQGGGASYFPGNSPGSSPTGGVYI